jgi:hypothetical protein
MQLLATQNKINESTAPMSLLQRAVHFMSKNVAVWKRLGANSTIISWLSGLIIPIDQDQTFIFPKQPPLTKEQDTWFEKQFWKYIEANAIEICLSPRAVHCYFLVPKTGKSLWRIIADLRPINPFVLASKFKMDGISLILSLISQDDYMFVADLSSGYFQVMIDESSRNLLAFFYKGQYWRYTVLPFGYSCSPIIFTKIMCVLTGYIHRVLRIRVSAYIDDIFGCVSGKQNALESMQRVYNVVDSVAVRDPDKCSKVPMQEVQVLGFLVNSVSMTISIPDNKVNSTLDLLKDVIRRIETKVEVTSRELSKVAGRICAFSEAFMQAKIFLPSFYALIHIKDGNKEAWDLPLQDTSEFKVSRFLEDANWIVQNLVTFNGRFFGQPLRVFGITIVANNRLRFAFQVLDEFTIVDFNTEICKVLERELVAILLTLQTGKFDRKRILLRVYMNITVQALLRNCFGDKSRTLVVAIWEEIYTRQIYMLTPVVSLDSEEFNPQCPADGTDWVMKQEVFNHINKVLSPITMDFFASKSNAKLSQFITRLEDTFFYLWNHQLGYFCVPFGLLLRVINKLQQEQAQAVIIVPVWVNQPWWNTLIDHEVDSMMLNGSDFVRGSTTNVEPQNGSWLIKAVLVDFQIKK